jgi:hypothetical protein
LRVPESFGEEVLLDEIRKLQAHDTLIITLTPSWTVQRAEVYSG